MADHYRVHQGLEIDSAQVIVTSGATEALASSLLALIEPGDEVVLIQPLYDAYLPLVLRAGGVPRLVRLTPPDWRITEEKLAEAFTDRTRLVVFNNPHNPTARLFGADELALLAAAAERSGALILADEVWEHLFFGPPSFPSIAGLPGMADRVVKVGSAGKIFSMTGWKVGWIVAPARFGRADRQGPPVRDLHDAAQSPGRRRLWPRQGNRLFRGDARRLCRPARGDAAQAEGRGLCPA